LRGQRYGHLPGGIPEADAPIAQGQDLAGVEAAEPSHLGAVGELDRLLVARALDLDRPLAVEPCHAVRSGAARRARGKGALAPRLGRALRMATDLDPVDPREDEIVSGPVDVEARRGSVPREPTQESLHESLLGRPDVHEAVAVDGGDPS